MCHHRNAIVPVWSAETSHHTSRGMFIAMEFTLNIFGVVVAVSRSKQLWQGKRSICWWYSCLHTNNLCSTGSITVWVTRKAVYAGASPSHSSWYRSSFLRLVSTFSRNHHDGCSKRAGTKKLLISSPHSAAEAIPTIRMFRPNTIKSWKPMNLNPKRENLRILACSSSTTNLISHDESICQFGCKSCKNSVASVWWVFLILLFLQSSKTDSGRGVRCFHILRQQQITVYAPTVFRTAGFSEKTAQLLSGFNNMYYMICTIVNVFTVDRLGRRFTLYYGAVLQGICLILVGILTKPNIISMSPLSFGIAATVFTFGYTGFFGMTWLAVPWLYPVSLSRAI